VAVPRLGSCDEGGEAGILRWIKSEGDEVKKAGARHELETDKVNVEVEVPDDGAVNSSSVNAGGFFNFGAVAGLSGK
jgi:pyruvate/2-oxoglutarate dehydrogenase complex dihydrolipoamide acyltransferase (E2) component